MAQLKRRWLSVLSKMAARVMNALAVYLAKPVRHSATSADAESVSAILRRGDVLLTQGVTRLAVLVRCLTGSTWSHVSMYVGPLEDGPDPRCVVEADVAAGVRAVPLSEFKGQLVRILRPRGLHDADKRRLADWVVSRIGDQYDMAHAWALARQLLGLPLVSRRSPVPGSTGQGARSFICSSLLAQAFVLVGFPIAPTQINVRNPDAADHRYVTPRDFEHAPVFEVVRATHFE